jgi:acyl-CoA oxidase
MRNIITSMCGHQAFLSIKLGLRYAIVRRQFKTIHGSKIERPLIDYQTHLNIYGTLVAKAFAIHFTGMYINDQFRDMMKDVKAKEFSRMDMTHHLLAGFKAIFAEEYVNISETVRRTCGGAGFASNSGFTELFNTHSAILLQEGDSTVMLLAASRYLLKMVKRASAGEKLPFPFEYISHAEYTLNIKGKGITLSECMDIDVLDQALQAVAIQSIMTFYKAYSAS